MTCKTPGEWKALSDQRHHTKTCSVRGCYEPVAKSTLSNLCYDHRKRYRAVGHPTGKFVTGTQFARHKRVYGDPFVARYEDVHPGMANAIAALDRLLAEAKLPASYGKHLNDLQRTEYWLAVLHKRGVTGKDILAGLIGLEVLRDNDPNLFKSDRHWRLQAVGRIMALGNRKQSGVGSPHKTMNQTGVRERELLYRRLTTPLGPLTLKAAQQIAKDSGSYLDRELPVPGVDAPFDA